MPSHLHPSSYYSTEYIRRYIFHVYELFLLSHFVDFLMLNIVKRTLVGSCPLNGTFLISYVSLISFCRTVSSPFSQRTQTTPTSFFFIPCHERNNFFVYIFHFLGCCGDKVAQTNNFCESIVQSPKVFHIQYGALMSVTLQVENISDIRIENGKFWMNFLNYKMRELDLIDANEKFSWKIEFR